MTPVTPAIPATPTTKPLEPSFSNLIAAIEQANGLPKQRRLHWVCSLRQIAKWLNRPPAVIPARWQAVRISVVQLHHARVGVTPKTLANHKSNTRAALRWFGNEHDVPQHGLRLTPDWARFYQGFGKREWQRVSSLVRYCSGRGIGPSEVSDETFASYWGHRAETTGLATHNTAMRFMVRAWNACADRTDGWALQRLTEPPLKTAEPALGGIPDRLAAGR